MERRAIAPKTVIIQSVMNDALPAINILKPGTFTSVEGKTVSFTARDLAQIAASYDAARDPAPIVIGHPRTNDPAYGWVGSLAVRDDVLIATPSQIAVGFAEAVRGGAYKKISAQLYQPGDPNSPDPRGWYLKHVGFLGAAAPAIKGLGTVSLADSADAVTIDLPDHIDCNPLEKPMSDTISLAEHQARLDKVQAELAEERARARQLLLDTLHADNVSFVEGASRDGRIAPAAKPLVIGLLDQLASLPHVSFAEGEAERAPAQVLKDIINAATPLVSFREAAPAEPGEAGKSPVSFASPEGMEVDPAGAALFAKAKRLQAAHPDLGWWQAVDRARIDA